MFNIITRTAIFLYLFLLALPQIPVGSPPDIESGRPLPVSGDDRRGPLSAGLTSYPVGWAHLYGGSQPDLFVVAGAHSIEPGLYLYRWKGTAGNGAPVFGEPRQVDHPGRIAGPRYTAECTVYQDGDTVRGLFLVKSVLIHAVFDKAKMTFVEQSRIALDSLPHVASAVALLASPNDKKLTLLFSASDGRAVSPPGPGGRDPGYVPYDGAGIWRGTLPYFGLYSVLRADLTSGPLGPASAILSPRQFLYPCRRLSVANLGRGHERDLIAGNQFGDMYFYANRSKTGADLAERRHAVGPDGNALRHPIHGNSPVAYPNPATHLSDILSGGEGALYWYRFSGRFLPSGAPVYDSPHPVLEENALLYAGSLPVPSVVDWDGDGRLDIIAGNSEGRILFFGNRGSDEKPAFGNGIPLSAGGREIHIQPGYKGDIQGPGEARWGYVSPVVVDWNGDGLPDILMGDSLSRHTVMLNRGSRQAPKLDPQVPLYLDGLDLHGTWRVRPAAARLGERMAYVALDDQDQFHLYWRIDEYNLADGGKLLLEDGSRITANFLGAGGTGRSKFELVDWDQDGLVDLLVGTPRHHSVPEPEKGLPRALGLPGATVLFLKNVNTNTDPKFRFPVVFRHKGEGIFLGQHEIGVSAGYLGGGGLNLLVSRENGRLYLYKREYLEWTPPR